MAGMLARFLVYADLLLGPRSSPARRVYTAAARCSRLGHGPNSLGFSVQGVGGPVWYFWVATVAAYQHVSRPRLYLLLSTRSRLVITDSVIQLAASVLKGPVFVSSPSQRAHPVMAES